MNMNITETIKQEMIKGGKFFGRKLVFSFISLITLIIGLPIIGHWPALSPEYGTFVGGVIAILAIYCGGNIGGKITANKQIQQLIESTTETTTTTTDGTTTTITNPSVGQ